MALPTLHPLNRATGSARYTSPNSPHTILATINGPHELPKRSDEIPDNVFVDVHVRPAVGVSGVRERRLEEIVKKTVGSAEILRGREMMRLGIMVGLLVVGGREGGGGTQGKEYISILPSLLNATNLALLDAGIPMHQTFASTLVAFTKNSSKPVTNPSKTDLEQATSIHAFAFTSRGDMIVSESEGDFNVKAWGKAAEAAKKVALGDGAGSVIEAVRGAVKEKVEKEYGWKEGVKAQA